MKKIRIGNKIVEVDYNEKGVPVLKARCEQIHNDDGTIDVIVHVPYLQVVGNQN